MLRGRTIYSFRVLAADYAQYNPQVKPGLIGSFTRIRHNGCYVDAQILDIEVDEDHLILVLEVPHD